MRPSLLIFLMVFLSLLPSNTQGIRLDKGLSSGRKKIHESGDALLRIKNGDARKLITETISYSTNSIKKAKSENVKEVSKQKGTMMEGMLTGNSLPNSENREAPEHTSENNVEIAEMDYSPASRKPPIHN